MPNSYDPLLGYKQYATEAQSRPTALGSATDAMQSGMYSGLEFAAKEAGFDSVADWSKAKAAANLAESQRYTPTGPQRVEEIHGLGDALDYAGNMAISQAPILGTMLGAGAAGALIAGPMGALAGAVASTAPMHLGEAYTRQKEMGVDDASKVWGAAGINTAMDVIPVGTFLNTARKLGGGTFAKAVARGAAAEGTTEAAQGAVVDYAAGIMPSLEEDYVMDRVNEAVAGAMLGGGMTGAGHAVGSVSDLPGAAYDTISDVDFDPMQGIKKATGYQEAEHSPFQDSVKTKSKAAQSADLEIEAIRNQLTREGFIYPEQEQWLNDNYSPEDIDTILDLENVQEDVRAQSDLEAQYLDEISNIIAFDTRELNTAEKDYLENADENVRDYITSKIAELTDEASKYEGKSQEEVYDETVQVEGVDQEFELDEQQFKDVKDTDTGETKEQPDAYIDPDAGFTVQNIRIGKLDDRGEKWDKDEDYLLSAERAKPYRTKTHKEDYTSSDDLIKKLNTSQKRQYKKQALIEGIEQDVRRDMRRESAVDKHPEELNTKITTFDEQGNAIVTEVPTDTMSVEERISARKAEVAADIMATRRNVKGDFYTKLTELYDEGRNPEAILNLYDSIESRQQSGAVRSGTEEFDYQDKQRIETTYKKSVDPKKDTTKISQGFVPLKPNEQGEYKRLNMIKAVKARKKELSYVGDTTDLNDRQLTTEAVKSVLTEYLDKVDLDDAAINVERKARTEVIPRFSESPKLRSIYKIVERIQNGDSMITKLPGRDVNGNKIELDIMAELDRTKGDPQATAKNLFHKLNLTSVMKNKKFVSTIADTAEEAKTITDEVKMENMLAEVGVSAKFVESLYEGESKSAYAVTPAEEYLAITDVEKLKAKKESTSIQLGNLDKKLSTAEKNKRKNWKLRDWEQMEYIAKDDEGKWIKQRDNTRLISDEEYKDKAVLAERKEFFADYPELEQELLDRAEWEQNKAHRQDVNRNIKRLESQIYKKELELEGEGREAEVAIAKQAAEADIKAEQFDKGEFDFREDMEDIADGDGQEGGFTSVPKAEQVEKDYQDKKKKTSTYQVLTAAEEMAIEETKETKEAPKQIPKAEPESLTLVEAKQKVSDLNKAMGVANKTKNPTLIKEALGNLNAAKKVRDELMGKGKPVGMSMSPDTKLSEGRMPWMDHVVNNNLHDSIKSIVDRRNRVIGRDTSATYIANRVLKMIDPNTSFYMYNDVPSNIKTIGKFGLHEDHLGVYNPDENMVVIREDVSNDDAVKIMVHEAIHAVTYNALQTYKEGKPITKRVKDLGDEITNIQNTMLEHYSYNPDIMPFYEKYATYDVHEFMAVALTDMNVMKAMRQIPYKRKTLLNRFSDAIRKFLGVKASEQNVLNAMLDISGEVFVEAEKVNISGVVDFKAPTVPDWVDSVGMAQSPEFLFQKHKMEKQSLLDTLNAPQRGANKLSVKRVSELNANIKEVEDKIQKLIDKNPKLKDSSFVPKPKVGLSKSFTQKFGKVGKSEMTNAQTQVLADKYLKDLGIKANIVGGSAALKLAKELGIEDAEFGMKFGSLHGFASASPNPDGSYSVYVNSAIQGKLRNEILEHELGHVVMYSSALDTNSKEASAVLGEFTKWLDKQGKDTDLVTDLIKSKKSPEAALLYMKQMGSGLTVKDVEGGLKDYLLDFDEWFADQAGKALARKTAPRTVTQKFFDKLVRALKKVFGVDDKVEAYIDRLRAKHQVNIPGKLTPELAALSRSFSTDVSNSSAFAKAKDTILNVLGDKDYNLRRLAGGNVEAFNELADLMFKPRGKTTMDNSYWHNKLLYLAKFDTRATDIMRGATRDVQDKVMQQLYNENLPNSSALQRTVKIRGLLKDLKEYMEKEGIKVPTRKNYFPNIVDQEYTAEHHDEFVEMMKRYPKEMEGITKKWNKDTESRARYRGEMVNKADLIEAADVPQLLYENIVRGDLMDEATSEGQQTPHIRFLKHRVIDFLEGADKVIWKDSYLQHSVTDATSTYIMQVVKRVEYSKRFGKLNTDEKDAYVIKKQNESGKLTNTKEEIKEFEKESEWTNRLEVLLDKARDEGATDKEIQHARDYVAAEMGTHGRDTAKWLNEKLGIPMPQSHAPINTDLQKATSAVMSVANVWVLGLSTITSLLDPIGIAVRSGSITQALSSMTQGIKVAVGKDRSELEVLAEAVGSISDIATKEALAHGYNMVNMTPTIKKMNDKFFHIIGLEQWTKTTRLMAVDAAQGFIKRHDASNPNSKPNKHSSRFLKELGLQEGDVKYGVNGKVKVLTYEQYQKASEKERARDDRVKSAIAEFVDTSILRPSPSQRPAWASDPHFALLFHLKSFMYSFQKTILNPLWQEAKQGNYAPLLAVSMYLPAGIAVGLVKDMFKTFGDDEDDWTPDYKENWGIGDYMLDGVEKSGLTGISQPIWDVQRSQKYGGTWVGGLFGPALEPWDTFNGLPVPLNYTWNNLTN